MDRETTDLIIQLCARAGMIMEDASPQAVIVTDRSEDGLRETLTALVEAATHGFSDRFGGYGYGFGHRGTGVICIILIVVVVLLLMGRL